jgi:phenylacetate-CoA ligase
MTEIGPVSYACPHSSEVLHILETEFLPEVVDPLTLEPVPVGGQGELVLTNFGRSASPLLRYRTGDLVQASSEPCGCGTLNMGLLGGIRGRVDDMVVVRGVNLHPSAVEAVLNQFQGIAEYRVALYTERSMWEVAIQIEPSEEVSSPNALRDEVEAALRATFNLRIPVVVVSLGTLPRFEMKSRRWVRTDLR